MNGSLFIITGESGSGKSTLVSNAIMGGVGKRILTCTTRAPRENNGIMERDGVDYYFLSVETFLNKLANKEFAEHALVYGNHYGTLIRNIQETRQESPVAFLIIDIQGAKTLMRDFEDAWSIFIHVEKAEMEERLRARGDTPDAIQRRLLKYDGEESMSTLCKEMLINTNGNLKKVSRRFIALVELYRSIDVATSMFGKT